MSDEQPPRPFLRWGSLALRVALALSIAYFGFLLRLRAAETLPLDNDEGGYYLAALVYADAIDAGDWGAIVDSRFCYEHPPLAKLIYAAAIVRWRVPPEIYQHPRIGPPRRRMADKPFKTSRVTASFFGALQVAILAVAYPPAGALLCIDTWHVKYTAQIMMEAVTCVFSTTCVMLYVRSRHAPASRRRQWLWASSVFLGLAAACKYPYAIVGICILIDWGLRTRATEHDWKAWGRRWLPTMLAWGMLSIVIFFMANPRLWSDPFNRLWESFIYHFHYAKSPHVIKAAHPPWQQMAWLSQSVPWHDEELVFLFKYDGWIALFSAIGLVPLWKRERVLAIWLIGAAVFLSYWNTKWPQYLLMLLVPQMVAAVEGLKWVALTAWCKIRGPASEQEEHA